LVVQNILSAVGNGAWAETLRWKFTPGTTLHYRMEQKNVTEVKAPGHDIKTTVTQVTETTWKVRSVDKDGKAAMEQTIDRIRMKIESPLAKPVEYDTARDVKPSGLVAATLIPTLKAIVGGTFHYNMTPRGEVSDLQLPDGLLQTLRDASPNGEGSSMFSEESLKSLILDVSLVLPENDLVKGASWSRRSKLAAALGTEVRDKTYTYEGRDDSANTEKIGVSVIVGLETPPNSSVSVEVRDQKDKGAYHFDNSAGRVTAATRSQTIRVVYSVISPQTRTLQEVNETRESSSAMTLVEARTGIASK
jgi:Family of unknown function (DUF6263)